MGQPLEYIWLRTVPYFKVAAYSLSLKLQPTRTESATRLGLHHSGDVTFGGRGLGLLNLKLAKLKDMTLWLKSPNLMPTKFSDYTVSIYCTTQSSIMFNPLTTNDEYACHETFILFQQCPWDRFSASRKVRTRGGGCVHPHGEDSKAVSGLGYKKTLIGTVWAVSPFLGIDGLRNSHLTLWSPFLHWRFFKVWTVGCWLRPLTIDEWVWLQSHKSAQGSYNGTCETNWFRILIHLE